MRFISIRNLVSCLNFLFMVLIPNSNFGFLFVYQFNRLLLIRVVVWESMTMRLDEIPSRTCGSIFWGILILRKNLNKEVKINDI